jgi:hypothetical protein
VKSRNQYYSNIGSPASPCLLDNMLLHRVEITRQLRLESKMLLRGLPLILARDWPNTLASFWTITVQVLSSSETRRRLKNIVVSVMRRLANSDANRI